MSLWYNTQNTTKIVGVIARGFISRLGPLAYPAVSGDPSTHTNHPTALYTPADPAVGIAGSAVSSPFAWNPIRLIKFRLVTSAAVGNRQVWIQVFNGASFLGRWYSAVTQAASLTRDYTFSDMGQAAFTFNQFVQVPMPNLYVGVQGVIFMNADGIDVADQISNIVVTADPMVDNGF
jgi:hypothetical protein